MIEQLELIICSAAEETERSEDGSRIRDVKQSLGDVSAEVWNQYVQETGLEFQGLADKTRPVAKQEFETCVELLASNAAIDGILLFPPTHADSVTVWNRYPIHLAALRENPLDRLSALVFRVSALNELGFRPVSEPIWDLLIRAAANPGRIQSLELSSDASKTEIPQQPKLPELTPDSPGGERQWFRAHLEAFCLEPNPVADSVGKLMRDAALKAGLFQIHDYLDASHELSQLMEGKGRHRTGDYWHAIMHRREPDYSNAKYWFRNVGSHPVYEPLAKAVDSLLAETDNPASETARQKLSAGGKWDPFAFVDFCQECESSGDAELTKIAKEIQWREMQFLLEQTYHEATA